MHPYKLVKDVRSGYESGNVDDVMNGNIDAFFKSLLNDFWELIFLAYLLFDIAINF